MPLSSTTISELKCAIARLDFLLTVADIKIKKITPDTKCSICQDAFSKDSWRFGETSNAPVQLKCGHVFGIQCLARLVYSTDFSNKCPLCRAEVISDTYEQTPSSRAWEVATPLLRVLTGLDRQLAELVKKETLDLLNNTRIDWTPIEGKHMSRTMIIYEEFMNCFCDHSSQAAGDNDRAFRAEQRVEQLQERLAIEIRLTEANAEAYRLGKIAAQSREDLFKAEAEFERLELQEQLEIEELSRTELELEHARATIVTRLSSILFGILSTIIVLYIWSHSSENFHAQYVTTANIVIKLCAVLVLFAAQRATSWKVAIQRGVISAGLLALASWNANAVRKQNGEEVDHTHPW